MARHPQALIKRPECCSRDLISTDCRFAFNRVFLTLCGGGICDGETLDVVRAEENFCEVAVKQRSDQPTNDG